jgi:hypothetical protein
LLTGQYKKLPLPNMPLILNVPQSWNIDVGKDFPATFVVGPSPSGHVMIQLSQPDANTFKQEQIDLIVTKAKKELADHKDWRGKVELLQVGGFKMLERLVFLPPHTVQVVDGKGIGMLDDKGNLVTRTVADVEWSQVIFLPSDQIFRRYELKLFDFTAEQYVQDQAFLEKIFRSVTVDMNAAPTPSLPAPTPPPQ